MLKKTIPLFLAFCMLLSAATVVSATEYSIPDDYIPVSGEIYSAPGIPTDGSGNISNISGTDITEMLENFQNNNSATVEDNNTKNNKMATSPIPEIPGASRYSSMVVSLADDIAGTKYEEAAELLGALGIMVGDAEDGAFRPNDPIIRSEMAKVATYSVGLEDIVLNSNGVTRFPDVPADHWATGAINVADQQKMVIGDDVGTFRPDDPVTLQEAVAIIVRALGYEPAANERGGYPAGYLYIASSNQILRGVDGSTEAPATRGDIAQLIFNSLTVNLMEQVGYGSQISYEVVDKTLLYDKLNVEKGYGQITGTSETTLTGGNTTADDRIRIDNNIFLEGESNARHKLGYNVLYYARIDKTTDEKTLIDVREQSNKNKSITVPAKDIVSVTGDEASTRTFEYWANDTDRNTRTVQIAGDATFIYNGKFKEAVSNEQLIPKSGNVIMLDSDTNGIYDIIFVNHFTNIVVDTVSTVTGRVTDKYLNGSLIFDENNSEVKYDLIKNGEDIELADLKEWNVISYTISDDKLLIKAYVSDASINGTVNEITEKGYRIGNSTTLYKKAESYPNTIELRDKGNFYLDIEGNIAAFDENASAGDDTPGNKKYGYLVDAMKNDGFETTAKFKIFAATGTTEIITSTEKMRFNGAYSTKAMDVLNALKDGGSSVTPQLIMYETNSQGNIIGIDTAHDGTATGEPNKSRFTLNIKKDGLVYKSASSKLGNAGIGSDTVIFDIPADSGNDTTKFSIRNSSSLSNDASYNALVYDLHENYIASAIIITSSTGTTAPESSILVVDHISETQNEDNEDTDRLYGWQDGEEVNILAYDKSILRKSNGSSTVPLSQGDIIQYRSNTAGEVDGITLLFDSNNKNKEFSNDITKDLTCVYGRVTKKFSGSVNLSVNDVIKNYATGDATVYLYDSSRTNNNIQVVSPADIEIYEEGNEARLFIRVYEDKVMEMVIVR